jgi:hypothetical protein
VDRNKKKQMDLAINELIIARRFQVAKKGPDVCLIKMINKRPVTIWLRYMNEGFFIEPPRHEFVCTYSHFEFSETENRYTRRKDILLSLVDHLQKTKVWNFILNKAFFVPNNYNKKMKRKVVEDQYYATTGLRAN